MFLPYRVLTSCYRLQVELPASPFAYRWVRILRVFSVVLRQRSLGKIALFINLSIDKSAIRSLAFAWPLSLKNILADRTTVTQSVFELTVLYVQPAQTVALISLRSLPLSVERLAKF